MKTTELIKHSAAINVERKTTYLQQFTWNVMLAQAFHHLVDAEEHEVSVKDLCEFIGLDPRNKEHLKRSLDGLVGRKVSWDVLGKDNKRKWGSAALLAGYEVEGDTLRYSFPKQLRQKLYSPEMYARINLLMQRNFSSKYAIPIYEECVNALIANSNLFRYRYGETELIRLEDFRKWMGIDDGQYEDFKFLNKRVIKEPVQEINNNTDLQIKVEFKRVNRKVVALRFKVTLGKHESGLASLPQPVVKNLENITLIDLLRQYNVDPDKVKKQILKKPDYVQFCIELLEWNKSRGEAPKKGDAAWLYSAITARQPYNHPKGFTTQAERAAAEAKRKAREDAAAQKAADEKAAAEARQQDFDRLYASLTLEERESLDADAVAQLDTFARQKYDELKRDRKKIAASPLVAAALLDARNKLLAEKYSDKIEIA